MSLLPLTTELETHSEQMAAKGKDSASWAFSTAAKLARQHIDSSETGRSGERLSGECPGCHHMGDLEDPPDLYHCNNDDCAVAVFREEGVRGDR